MRTKNITKENKEAIKFTGKCKSFVKPLFKKQAIRYLVSKNTDGIYLDSETALNCGFIRRFYLILPHNKTYLLRHNSKVNKIELFILINNKPYKILNV